MKISYFFIGAFFFPKFFFNTDAHLFALKSVINHAALFQFSDAFLKKHLRCIR